VSNNVIVLSPVMYCTGLSLFLSGEGKLYESLLLLGALWEWTCALVDAVPLEFLF